MERISLAEAFEYGLTIADLQILLEKRFEELYESPDPAETIRRIAISQDAWSFQVTRRWLKQQLLSRKPWRRHYPDLDAVVDSTLIKFYSGEKMSHFTSLAQAQEFSAQSAGKRVQMATVADEILAELTGITAAELPAYLVDVIAPKYGDGWMPGEFEAIVLEAVKQHAETLEFQTSYKTAAAPRWSGFFAVREYLEQSFGSRPGHVPIPDVVPTVGDAIAIGEAEEAAKIQPAAAPVQEAKESAFKEAAVKQYDWSPHRKSFETPKGLKVGLVNLTNEGELMLEIGQKDAPQCARFVLGKNGFIGVGDDEQILEILKAPENVKMMVGFIRQQFASTQL